MSAIDETERLLAQDRWLALSEEAKKWKGVSSPGNAKVPEWYDRTRFNKSQRYLKRNYPSVLLSVYNGVLFGMAHKGLAGPHLYRDTLSTLSRFSRFVISFNYYVLVWITGDLFDPNDKSFQTVRNVRSLHSHIAKRMNERDGKVEGKDVLWINQLEMILIMLRAIELAALFPDGYCNLGRKREERQSVYYFARVITYCMGLEDRFNIYGWPTDQFEAVVKRDFWDNIYPVIINKQFLDTIKSQTLHEDIEGSKILKLFYYLMKREIFYLAKLLEIDPSLLGKSKLGFTGYSHLKYLLSNKLIKMPGVSSYLMIVLARAAYKRKNEIVNLLT